MIHTCLVMPLFIGLLLHCSKIVWSNYKYGARSHVLVTFISLGSRNSVLLFQSLKMESGKMTPTAGEDVGNGRLPLLL